MLMNFKIETVGAAVWNVETMLRDGTPLAQLPPKTLAAYATACEIISSEHRMDASALQKTISAEQALLKQVPVSTGGKTCARQFKARASSQAFEFQDWYSGCQLSGWTVIVEDWGCLRDVRETPA
jgi:hypothetical protein